MATKSKIYTRTGDSGTTSLVGGARVAKNHIRLEAYGTIDELNSFLGLLRAQEIDATDKENILKIQNDLLILAGALATADEKQLQQNISEDKIQFIENQIDIIDNELPTLQNFVIPSGFQPAAICHICRTVCRRAERMIYSLSKTTKIPDLIGIYINRLSDYLFVLARKIDIKFNKEEIFFK